MSSILVPTLLTLKCRSFGTGGRRSRATEEQLNLPSCHGSWAASRPVQTPWRERRAPAPRHTRQWPGWGALAGLPPSPSLAWQPSHWLLGAPRHPDNGFVFYVPRILVIISLSMLTVATREKYKERGEQGVHIHKIRGLSGISNKVGLIQNLGSWEAGGRSQGQLTDHTEGCARSSSAARQGPSGSIACKPSLQISASIYQPTEAFLPFATSMDWQRDFGIMHH